MTVEYLPVGIACNLKCEYCYQDSMRDAGNINTPRNWYEVESPDENGSALYCLGGELCLRLLIIFMKSGLRPQSFW
jgi:MoaA/NifB/PqqE/SkfB family radical SAM enzyme